MQSVIEDNRLEEVRTRLSGEIKATKKRIHPVLHPLFNLTMQNKIDHANRILRLMDRYPKITVEELFYWIACRIEGEKYVVSSYRWSVPMLQETYDNRDNLERLQYLVWDAGVKHNGKNNTVVQNSLFGSTGRLTKRDAKLFC